MTTQSYTVSGMTCAHCVASVTEEIETIPGVRNVAVALDGGRLTFDADAPVSDEVVKSAVEEAGYALAGARDLPLA